MSIPETNEQKASAVMEQESQLSKDPSLILNQFRV